MHAQLSCYEIIISSINLRENYASMHWLEKLYFFFLKIKNIVVLKQIKVHGKDEESSI